MMLIYNTGDSLTISISLYQISLFPHQWKMNWYAVTECEEKVWSCFPISSLWWLLYPPPLLFISPFFIHNHCYLYPLQYGGFIIFFFHFSASLTSKPFYIFFASLTNKPFYMTFFLVWDQINLIWKYLFFITNDVQ